MDNHYYHIPSKCKQKNGSGRRQGRRQGRAGSYNNVATFTICAPWLAECGFDDLEMAAGKAPDMSHLDAGICPFIEREVEEAGATTSAEILAAVAAAWKKITPAMCEKISKRVRANKHFKASDSAERRKLLQ